MTFAASSMSPSRKCYLSLLASLALSSTASDAILSILEAVSFSASNVSLTHVAAAASAFRATSLGCIAIYTYQQVRHERAAERSRRTRRVLSSLAILISATASIISLASTILIKSRWSKTTALSSERLISTWNEVLAGQITAWTISCISQILLFSFPLWHRQPFQVHEVAVSGPRDSVMSEIHTSQASRHFQPMQTTWPSSPPAGPIIASPTLSSPSMRPLQNFRDSLRQVVRPVTSRTTLIGRSSMTWEAQGIDSQSMDNTSHSDGFDSWDTRDALVQTAHSKSTILDPIPGSRPDSPARILEGPFLSQMLEAEDYEEFAPRPRMMPDTSRPPSPAISEAHIHPLFRTESASQAPEATPGTSIVASPYATQAITYPARSLRQMRSTSRSASPSNLVRAESFARSRATSLSRSSSPPSRGMTPPIPDFVLNSSPRSSMSGSRRVNLLHQPDR